MPQVIVRMYGTRPEAIKMAPVVLALEESRQVDPLVAVTGRRREMLDQVDGLFGITPAHDLDIIQPRQRAHEVTQRVLGGLITDVIRAERPGCRHGAGRTRRRPWWRRWRRSTRRSRSSTSRPGLRTDNRYNPFPEEINRRLTSQLTSLHLAPTPTLASEPARGWHCSRGRRRDRQHGDRRAARTSWRGAPAREPALEGARRRPRGADHQSPRGESWGEPMARTAARSPGSRRSSRDVRFVLPAHLNPTVREVLLPPLAGLDNVTVTEPLSYGDFARAMDASSIMLTDSGGVQEEAPSLGKPVLVMRETTERPRRSTPAPCGWSAPTRTPSWTRAGAADGPGAYDAMARTVNPYGDGRAAERCRAAIESFFGVGERLPDFVAGGSAYSGSAPIAPGVVDHLAVEA